MCSSFKDLRITLTGGAGFVGSHLLERLLENGSQVTVLDDFSFGTIENLASVIEDKRLEIVKGSVTDMDTCMEVTKDADIVYHLAAHCHVDLSIERPTIAFKVNAEGTLNMLESARHNNVEKFIMASSSEAYGSAKYIPMDESHPLNPHSPYGASKAAADRLCYAYYLTYGLPVVIVRCFNIFGPRQRYRGYSAVIPTFIYRTLNNKPPIIYGSGDQARDYMFVDDAVWAYILVGEGDDLSGEVINFGTGKEISINDIASIVLKICGKNLLPVHITPRPGEVGRLCADISKAKKLFGFQSKWSLEEGIRESVRWLNGYNPYGIAKSDHES